MELNLKMLKFESPARLAELDPTETLRRIGLESDTILCDIGAGTGIFAFAAAMACRQVYALEISDDMIDVLESRKRARRMDNLAVLKVEDGRLPLPDGACDIALLCTVFHEIADTTAFLPEAARILRKDGRLAIIEFHKRVTPMGPPVSHRASEDDVALICCEHGFIEIERFTLGDNFYVIVMRSAL